MATALLSMLPAELGSISEPEECAMEYLHYRQFFNIWEALARVVECQALELQQMNKDTRSAWLKDYMVCLIFKFSSLVHAKFSVQGLVDRAHEQIVKLLTSEWLVNDVESLTGTF